MGICGEIVRDRKCCNCSCLHKQEYVASNTNGSIDYCEYVCWGVRETFKVNNINDLCSAYPQSTAKIPFNNAKEFVELLTNEERKELKNALRKNTNDEKPNKIKVH